MIVKLLTEHHLEFLSLKGGCRGSSESTLVKMSNCWKSHAAAHFSYFRDLKPDNFIINNHKLTVVGKCAAVLSSDIAFQNVLLCFSLHNEDSLKIH